MPSTRLAGRLNLLLSQLPGRFWAPFSIEPSSLMTPGQAMPMKGASFSPSASASVIRPFSIFTSSFTVPSRLGSSSAWRHNTQFPTRSFLRVRHLLQAGFDHAAADIGAADIDGEDAVMGLEDP